MRWLASARCPSPCSVGTTKSCLLNKLLVTFLVLPLLSILLPLQQLLCCSFFTRLLPLLLSQTGKQQQKKSGDAPINAHTHSRPPSCSCSSFFFSSSLSHPLLSSIIWLWLACALAAPSSLLHLPSFLPSSAAPHCCFLAACSLSRMQLLLFSFKRSASDCLDLFCVDPHERIRLLCFCVLPLLCRWICLPYDICSASLDSCLMICVCAPWRAVSSGLRMLCRVPLSRQKVHCFTLAPPTSSSSPHPPRIRSTHFVFSSSASIRLLHQL